MINKANGNSLLVTVIGWLFIIGAGALLLNSFICAMSYGLQLSLNRHMLTLKEVLPRPFGRGGAWMFYLFLWAVVQMVVAIFVVVAGLCFRNHRAWARMALEVISWACLALVGVYLAFWVCFSKSPLGMLPPMLVVMFYPLSLLGVFVSWIGLGILGVSFGTVLFFLRKKSVRDAFCPKPF